MMTYGVFVSALFLACSVASQGVGESCVKNGVRGVCRLLKDCQSDLAELRSTGNYQIIQRCGFEGLQPISCCADLNATPTTVPVATTPRIVSTTTEYIPPDYDYVTNVPVVDACAPLRPDQTVPKTGGRAWDKCVEYHEQLVQPCERSVALLGGLARSNHCALDPQGPGVWNASRDTAPYVALLGSVLPGGSVSWRCSGALLSERFILCAAHCAFGKKRHLQAVAMVGSRKSSHNENNPQVHRIKRVIRHPQYRVSKQSDLALVETETPITLDKWTVPACLDVFGGDRSTAMTATWIKGTPDLVQKVTVEQEIMETCMPMLGNRKLSRLDLTAHVCYREDTSPLDICQPDSWGPLTIRNPKISCMHSVIGVSSIGVHCSKPRLRLITMVEHYVPWIEGIVWP